MSAFYRQNVILKTLQKSGSMKLRNSSFSSFTKIIQKQNMFAYNVQMGVPDLSTSIFGTKNI